MTVPADFPIEDLQLEFLHLDSQNPRLPEELQGSEEQVLLEHIAETYDPLVVAESLSVHGYFPSEPIIVIRDESREGHYIVVEGNRRVVALRLLAEPSLAESLDDHTAWKELSDKTDVPTKIPAVIAPHRAAVAPIIGYRHISGIEPWEPYAKARFLAQLVDAGTSFEESGRLVGERHTEVAAQYRNHQIVEQARERDIDVAPTVDSFGVFTRAMTSAPLRTYVGAPAPSAVSAGAQPIPDDKTDELKELLSWLFGDATHPPVIGESRDITELGTVVDSEEGLRLLKTTRDLEAAFVAAGGLRDRLVRRLTNAHNSLVAAAEDYEDYSDDDQVKALLAACQVALDNLEVNGS